MVQVMGEEGALGAAGGWYLQQRHGWLSTNNKVISRVRKCLLLRLISIVGVACDISITMNEYYTLELYTYTL